MKIVEEKYWVFIKMLENLNSDDEIVIECLSQKLVELSFNYFRDNSKITRKHIFDIYKTRSIVLSQDKDKEPFTIGYDKLLPVLEKSDLEFVSVSSITSEKGTYIVFSDYEFKVFIGILKSERTLQEVRGIMQDSEYYREITFFNGKSKI